MLNAHGTDVFRIDYTTIELVSLSLYEHVRAPVRTN